MSKSLQEELEAAYDASAESAIADEPKIEDTEHVQSAEEQPESEGTTPLVPTETVEVQAPEHWAAEDKEVFKSIDQKGREFLLRRHKDMEAAHTRKLQALAEESKIAENFKKTISPHKAYLEQLNIDPLQAVEKLIATEMRLRMSSPHEKALLMQELARQYGAQFDPNAPQQPEIDQKTQLILEAIKKQDDRLAQIENERRENERRGLEGQISSFANAKDEKGVPKHPHFEKVRSDMGLLIQTGKAQDLDEAYEQAILLNVELRKDYFAKQYREEDTAKKAVASKKAPLNIRGGSDSVISDPTKQMSLEDTIRAAIDAQERKRI